MRTKDKVTAEVEHVLNLCTCEFIKYNGIVGKLEGSFEKNGSFCCNDSVSIITFLEVILR